MAVRDYEALRKIHDEQLQRYIERMPPEELEKRAIDGVLRNREAAYQDAATRREELAPKLDWKVAAEKLVAALREVRRA